MYRVNIIPSTLPCGTPAGYYFRSKYSVFSFTLRNRSIIFIMQYNKNNGILIWFHEILLEYMETIFVLSISFFSPFQPLFFRLSALFHWRFLSRYPRSYIKDCYYIDWKSRFGIWRRTRNTLGLFMYQISAETILAAENYQSCSPWTDEISNVDKF